MIQYPEYKHGELVTLDKNYNNSSTVKVISQTQPSRIYTTVEDPETGYRWETMTNRLTKIEDEK